MSERIYYGTECGKNLIHPLQGNSTVITRIVRNKSKLVWNKIKYLIQD